MLSSIIFSILAYLLGCICFGYYLTRLLARKSLNEIGSKSLGASNVARVLGKKGFIITFSLDFLKGLSIVLCAKYQHFEAYQLFIFSFWVILGHIFPIQLNFRGGKGVSTFLGAMLGINYLFIIFLAGTCLLLYPFIKKFSIAGIFSIAIFPIFTFFLHFSAIVVSISILEMLVIVLAHRKNISTFFNQ